jgi:CBS domain-containing protein
MTRSVITTTPDTPLAEAAKTMVDRRISALPVVAGDALVGIVSEGDLLRRAEIGTECSHRGWLGFWLSNDRLATDYLKQHGRTVQDVMTRLVVTVDPSTDIAEIARTLETEHIKRVPVVEDGKIVGIVSRANIVQALASSGPGSLPPVPHEDADLQNEINDRMSRERWCSRASALVKNGVVDLWGFVDTEKERRALVTLAETVPGVRKVEDNVEYTPVVAVPF